MVQELRQTVRRLRHSPLYTVAVMVILTTGIGVTVTMLSVLNALVWRPVDIPDPGSLVAVSSVNARDVRRVMPLATLTFLEQSDLPTDAWCAYNAITEATDGVGRPVDAYVALLSGNCPGIIGVTPALGRWFTSSEVRLSGASQAVALISHHYWRHVFNQDPNVLGRPLKIFNATVEVIGVLPETFRGLSTDYDTDIFVPFNAHRPATTALTFITRLPDRESLSAFRARASALWPSLLTSVLPPGPTQQQALKDLRGTVGPLATGFSRLRELYGSSTAALAGLSALLLVLICLNVGGLFVSRWLERRQEVATMRAMGAHGGRIARLVLVEAGVLVAAGAAVGLPAAYVACSLIARVLPVETLAQSIDFRPDRDVVALATAGCVVLAGVMSVVPIWQLTRDRSREAAERAVARRTTIGGRVLLIAQVAFALSLIVTTTLIVRSLDALLRNDRGFRGDHVLSARLFPNPGTYQKLDQLSYYPELVRRLSAIPGVQSVGAARYFSSIDVVVTSGQPVSVDRAQEAETNAFLEYVLPQFFETLGVPLLHGRDVDWTDLPSTTPVALVSDSLARSLGAAGADVVGRTLWLGGGTSATRLVVIGVVGNVSLGNFRQTDPRVIYRSGLQAAQATMSTMHLRTEGDPMSVAAAVTATVDSFGHEHVIGPYPLDRYFANSLVAERLAASISVAQALLALAVSCLGLYVLIARGVAARTKEIGIRLALGAAPLGIWQAVVRDGLLLAVVGVVIGYPVSRGAALLVRSLLFDVTAADTPSFVVGSGLLLVSALVAAGIPAWRATRIDPGQALRSL